ncbi:MAG: class I SAM-dependent methyltransferase [Planctomycetales bacterium]|nr:class I SAM-dependent methyltransferase [Planctomycetales bacterium]
MHKKPFWQLPLGVNRGTWDYLTSSHIATEYDNYFTDSGMMKLDLEFILPWLPKCTESAAGPIIADLGCGTARVAERFQDLDYRFLNIDLSEHMLSTAQRKGLDRQRAAWIQANLVELDGLNSCSIDMAVCLFSSLGMIQGRAHRLTFLKHVVRCLKPGALFICHVHNRYRSLLDPGGLKWLLSGWWKEKTGTTWEYGDRVYAYRGLPAMFLHIFSRREILSDLACAGFENHQVFPIAATGDALLSKRSLLVNIRAGGYFVVSRSPVSKNT